jgi:Phage integrase, N-terminal SAM-like domain
MPDATRSQQPTRLHEVRRVLRLHHSSMHTERASVEWSVRFVHFHGMRARDHLFPAEPKIEAFLTDLAVHEHVAAKTQNQALHAPVCLDTRPLNHELRPHHGRVC